MKAIFDVSDSVFSNNFVLLVNDIKSFDFGHMQKCPFWPMPLHFRNVSAASAYTNGNYRGGGGGVKPPASNGLVQSHIN